MMETILSDGKTLEIERMLKITVFLPQPCHFCGEEITKFGRESGSLCFHSLDGNHDNWEPSNKVPAHYGCHASFHVEGDKHPMKDPKVVATLSKTMMGRPKPWMRGDNHPMKRPEQRQRMRDNNPLKDPVTKAKHLESLRTPEYRARMSELIKGENNPNYGDKVSSEERTRRAIKAWATRRKGRIQDLDDDREMRKGK